MSDPRVLVLGASGMLGHEAVNVLSERYEVWAACRRPADLPFAADRVMHGRLLPLDIEGMNVPWILETAKPDVVVNAVGVVKQLPGSHDAITAISLNSLFPHVVAELCARVDARLVHVSTDCVFDGTKGMYVEDDRPDAPDLYGRSKALGEVNDRENAVTLRTSIIGWQLDSATSLAGWFAAHRRERLTGYTKAVFSGLTTQSLSEVIRDVVIPEPELSGLWHVSAAPIDKFTLLSSLAAALGWEVELEPSEALVIDRSLDSTRFRERTGWRPDTWPAMLVDLANGWPG